MLERRIENRDETELQKKFNAVSHDIKNLLHNVLTGIDLLKEKNEKNETRKKLLNSVEQNAILASEILDQFSKSDSVSHPNKSRLDLKKIIIDICELLGDDSNRPISFHEDNKNHIVTANYADIKRVLLNLIINAREAGDISTNINLMLDTTTIKSEVFSRITVEDNGPGISKAYIKKIFDRGFSTKEKSSNEGLGLSIVKTIMEGHNGRLNIKSYENTGTKIELLFPLNNVSKKKIDIKNRKVVIAEDDNFQREVLEDLLRSMKINVYSASNGIEAFDLFISEKPDILFIDDKMPEMSGLECIEKIANTNSSAKIVLLSGSDISDLSSKQNITKVLKKPYGFEVIEKTLKELL